MTLVERIDILKNVPQLSSKSIQHIFSASLDYFRHRSSCYEPSIEKIEKHKSHCPLQSSLFVFTRIFSAKIITHFIMYARFTFNIVIIFSLYIKTRFWKLVSFLFQARDSKSLILFFLNPLCMFSYLNATFFFVFTHHMHACLLFW